MNPQIKNTLLAIVIATGMIVSFYFLERAFRGGDVRRAVQAVQQLQTKPNGPTIMEELKEKYGPDARFFWMAKVESSFRGLIHVTCTMPDKDKRAWRVDVLFGRVEELPLKKQISEG